MTYQDALVLIRKEKSGLLEDLYKEIDPKLVTKMELTGLIQRGQESDRRESWKITQKATKGHNLKELYGNYKPTHMEKLQAFFNNLIFSKQPLSV